MSASRQPEAGGQVLVYERLRVILHEHGYDPELALEDEGYGVGVNLPEGVHQPTTDECRYLINLAKQVPADRPTEEDA